MIRLYDESLRQHGYHAAQMLLTGNDFKNRVRYLNVRNTLHALFEFGVVPVINENDTVSIDEIRFGDNDHLAAMVANLLELPLLVILTVVEGLFDGPPEYPGSQLISLVDRWDDDLLSFATQTGSMRGSGGMQTKLEAVRTRPRREPPRRQLLVQQVSCRECAHARERAGRAARCGCE